MFSFGFAGRFLSSGFCTANVRGKLQLVENRSFKVIQHSPSQSDSAFNVVVYCRNRRTEWGIILGIVARVLVLTVLLLHVTDMGAASGIRE